MTTALAVPGTLHRYTPHLVAFAHSPHPLPSDTPAIPTQEDPPNILLLIGGLSDTLLTVAYTSHLHRALPPSWTLVSPLLSSSGTGWGTSSLDTDADELAACVKYFQELRPGAPRKTVLLGHSTGAQDVMHYLLSSDHDRPRVDGAILQGCISDREALLMTLAPDDYDHLNARAHDFVRAGRGDDVLPRALSAKALPGVPLSARRWLSLASPGPAHEGPDDLFSSDLGDARLARSFGKAGATGVPLCILYGGADEHVPGFVDREKLVGRWVKAVREGGGRVDEGSGVLEGVGHTMAEGGEGREEFLRRVVGFLGRV